MQKNPTPEYILLFQAISKAIESLQERLIFQAIFKSTTDDGTVAYLQKLQLFLIGAQQKAEEIFLNRTE